MTEEIKIENLDSEPIEDLESIDEMPDEKLEIQEIVESHYKPKSRRTKKIEQPEIVNIPPTVKIEEPEEKKSIPLISPWFLLLKFFIWPVAFSLFLVLISFIEIEFSLKLISLLIYSLLLFDLFHSFKYFLK